LFREELLREVGGYGAAVEWHRWLDSKTIVATLSCKRALNPR